MDTFPPRVSVSAFCEIRLQAINLRGQADTGRQDGFGPCTSALRSWSWGAGRAKKAGKARLGSGESVGRDYVESSGRAPCVSWKWGKRSSARIAERTPEQTMVKGGVPCRIYTPTKRGLENEKAGDSS